MRRLLTLAALVGLTTLGADPEAYAQATPEEFKPVELGAGSLVYAWPVGEELHYRAQMYLSKPRGIRFYATENLDARVSEITMAMLVVCTAQPPERRSQMMTCEVHRVEAGAATRTNEDHKARPIFEEYREDLERATIQLEWAPNGRLMGVDLEGVEKDIARTAVKHEYLRLLVRHALSPLELEMPKDGDPKGKSWRQKGSPMAMRLPTTTGTVGGVRVLHDVLGEDADGYVVIRTVGEGVVNESDNMEGNQHETKQVFLSGLARFDAQRGILVSSERTFQGVFSTQAGRTSSDLYINQVTLVELLPNFDALDKEYLERTQAAAKPAAEPRQVIDLEAAKASGSGGSSVFDAPKGADAPEAEGAPEAPAAPSAPDADEAAAIEPSEG